MDIDMSGDNAKTNPIVEPAVTTKPSPVSDGSPFKDRVPCNWILQPVEDSDEVEARNLQSGETFMGTREEFNSRLKG